MGFERDATFRTIANIWTAGGHNAQIADHTGVGFRPKLLKMLTIIE